MRSLLTMLGILIGIAAVMLTVGLGEGARQQITAGDQQAGQQPAHRDAWPLSNASLRSSSSVMTLTLDDADRIADPAVALDVAGVAPVMGTRVSVQYGTDDWSSQATGTTTAWPEVRARNLIDGRFFTEVEQASAAQVVVLGPTTAGNLFSDTPAVGQEVVISGQTFLVVGVLESVGANSMTNDDDLVVLPITTVAQRLVPSSARSLQAIYVAARDDAAISSAHQQITRAITVNHARTTADQDFDHDLPGAAQRHGHHDGGADHPAG